MIQIISGNKGKGKTKILLEQANKAVKEKDGSIVYLDKSINHMYELNNRIRLINVLDYHIDSKERFFGFISGIIASDHDLEQIYLDSFLKLARIEADEIEGVIDFLNFIGSKNQVTFILSVSADECDLPESVRKYVTVSL